MSSEQEKEHHLQRPFVLQCELEQLVMPLDAEFLRDVGPVILHYTDADRRNSVQARDHWT